VVRLARAAAGCLDFALGADLVEPGRINVLERWASRTDLEAFRGSGPPTDMQDRILAAWVAEHEVSDA
jgi:quinol monooxygenase YgiN